MSEKFTKVPWKAERVDTAVGHCWRIGPFNACIYVDELGGVCNPELSATEAEAVAHLISAAPDLYAACEAALKGYTNILDSDLMPHEGYDADTKMLINTLSAALAKARGDREQ